MNSTKGNLKNRKGNLTIIKKQNESEKIQKVLSTSINSRNPTSGFTHKLCTRLVIFLSLIVIVYFYSERAKETRFALKKENITLRQQKFQCSSSYLQEISQFPNCIPKKCGRFVTDALIDRLEVDIMLEIAKKGMSFGGSDGGASILDLHSGALSYGQHFINIYNIPEAQNIFKPEHVTAYKLIKAKIRKAIADKFEIDENQLYLTHPSFFSRITNNSAKTIHDEYWHHHVDKETYESFHYTSLLYLTSYENDFHGGKFIFVDGIEGKNQTTSSIEPKKGRVSAFSSGSENLHYVEKVIDGTRFAITISFTCNPKFAINDPILKSNPTK